MKLIHPSLIYLLRLRGQGAIRRFWRSLSTLRGVFYAIAFAIPAAFFCGVMVLSFFLDSDEAGLPITLDQFRQWAPLVIFGMAVAPAFLPAGRNQTLTFQLSETAFLFTGPFDRRHVVLYKLLENCLGLLFVAAIFTFFAFNIGCSPIPAYIGFVITLAGIQLILLFCALAGQALAESAYNWPRRMLIGAGATLVLAGCASAAASVPFNGDILSTIQHIPDSAAYRIGLAPFIVFANLIAAQSLFPCTLYWAVPALAINGALAAAIFKLDAYLADVVVRSSEQAHERMEKVRKGGTVYGGPTSRGFITIPALPRLGGMGPNLWRQAVTAARSRSLQFTIALAALVGVITAAAVNYFVDKWGPDVSEVVSFFGEGSTFAVAYLTLMLINALRYDFRGDFETMERLKTLPLPPLALAASQLVTPVLAIFSFIAALTVPIAILNPIQISILVMPLQLAPFALLLVVVENFFFLLYPGRTAGLVSGDIQGVGRSMMLFLFEGVFAIVCGIPAAIFGFLAWTVTRNVELATSVGALVLFSESLLLIPLVAWAFERYDPSTHEVE